MFTAQYGLIPYIKQITFRLLKVNRHTGGRRNNSRGKGVKVVHVRKLFVMLECVLFCICSGILCKCMINRVNPVCVISSGGTI